MKKIYKLVPIVLLLIMIFLIAFSNIGYAQVNIDNIKNDKSGIGDSQLKSAGGIILSVITTFGVALSVIMLAVIGIRYMLGSVEEKAEYKKTMVPYLIGCVLVFSASTIASAVYNAFK